MITGARARTTSVARWWSRSLPGYGVRRVRDLNLATHILALTAQQVLCTAPLVVALSAVLQRETGRDAGSLLARFFGLHQAAAKDVTALFSGSGTVSTTALLIGLLVAVGFATSVATTQQRGFELMWRLPRVGGPRAWWRQVLWAVALPGYVVAMTVGSRAGRAAGHPLSIAPVVETLLQALLTLLFLWWSQHLLLSGRVPWRHLFPGSLIVAVGTVGLVKLSTVVLAEQIDEQVTDYGLIGAVFVLSVWLVVLSGVLLGGALLGTLLVEHRGRRGQLPRPPDEAAPERTRTAEQATEPDDLATSR